MKRYPAQIRYEKKHPVISFRLSRGEKERLEKVLEGKSFADFVKEGIGVREREKKSLKKEYRKGYDNGYEEAKNKFAIRAPCVDCGEPITVQTDWGKKELSRFIKRERWSHASCEGS